MSDVHPLAERCLDADALASIRVLVGFFRWRGETETAKDLEKLARRFAIHHIDGNPRNNAPANCRVVWIGENGRG